MAKKTKAYLDTSAIISFLDLSDSYHNLFVQLFSSPPKKVFTTPLVIAEGHGWFLKRFDQHRAKQFMLFIEDCDFIEILNVGAKEQYLNAFVWMYA